jgi:hypothetical protein
MRNRTPTVLVALLAAVLLAACATVPADRAVLNTLQIIQASAVSTMTVIGQLYQAGQITEPQKVQAEAVYNRLQAGCKAVAASASTVTTAQQGADLTVPLQQLCDQLTAMLKTFQMGGGK